MIQQYVKLILAATLMGSFSAQAQANSCGELSPLYEKIGDEYAQLNYSSADAAGAGKLSKESLIELFDTTELRSGNGVRYRCFGSDSARRNNPIKFALEDIVRVETARGNVQLTAWEESRRKVKSAVIDLPNASEWVSSSRNEFSTTTLMRRRNGLINELFDASSRDDYSKFFPLNLREVSALSEIESEGFTERLDRMDYDANPRNVGYHLAEIATKIKRTGSGLQLTQIIYINGRTAEWVTWEIDG